MTAGPAGEFLLPLFPLPNLVFFPHTRLPLHVFEPRYRQMVKDVMESDHRFGIVLLASGWEKDYFGAPAVHTIGTLGVVEQAIPLEDGRYNVIVRGDSRFRILDEVSRIPYRTARVVIEPELIREPEAADAKRLWLADLARQYMTQLPDQSAVPEIDTASLESLTNALVMSLNLDAEEKQGLLEMSDVIARAEEVGNDLAVRIESLRFLAPFRREGGDPSHN